jgi:hypothetical protein
MLTDANCAAPANTTIDMTIVATAPSSGSASTPNDVPTANAGSTSGRPALTPSLRSLGSNSSVAPRGPAASSCAPISSPVPPACDTGKRRMAVL